VRKTLEGDVVANSRIGMYFAFARQAASICRKHSGNLLQAELDAIECNALAKGLDLERWYDILGACFGIKRFIPVGLFPPPWLF